MKNKKLSLSLVVLLMGVILMLAFIPDAALFLSGKKLDLNTASQTDFIGKAAVEGEVFYPIDYFATYEETETHYGIPTSKTETYYYLVANFNKETLRKFMEEDVDFEEFYVVYSTSNKEHISQMNALVDKWNAWYDAYDNGVAGDYPEGIVINGKLADQPDDAEYIQYRDEFLDYGGFLPSEIAEKRIVDGKITFAAVIGLLVGILLTALGIFLIIRLIKGMRRPKDDDFGTAEDIPEPVSAGSEEHRQPVGMSAADAVEQASSADALRQLRAQLNTGEITQDEYDEKLKEMLGK